MVRPFFCPLLVCFVFWTGPCFSQPSPDSSPISSDREVPSSTETVEPAEPIPSYDFETSSRIHEGSVIEGRPFTYSLELCWHGNQRWYALKQPEVNWPDRIRQVSVSTRTVSSTGSTGPIGRLIFKYTLQADRSGSYQLPAVRIQLKSPDSEELLDVAVLGKTVRVEERKETLEERLRKTVAANWIPITGVGVLVVAALGFYFYQSKRERREEEPDEDPWEPIRNQLQHLDALRSAGDFREYYSGLEQVIRDAFSLHRGCPIGKISEIGDCVDIPVEGLAEDVEFLAREIAERKYRPDRPRPEQMNRSQQAARRVIESIRSVSRRKGSDS